MHHCKKCNRLMLAIVISCGIASQSSLAGDIDPTCYALFERQNAIPGTKSCDLVASAAGSGMGTYYCTAGTSYITTYCGDKCYNPVTDLGKLPQPSNSPTSGFIKNQLCIAKSTCLEKEILNNKKWADAVIPDFISPFTSKSGEWNSIIWECTFISSRIPKFWQEKYCEGRMAKYHIQTDLQNSLNKNGCGTISDWNSIGRTIESCISKNSEKNPFMGFVADQIVQRLRNAVRENCIAFRSTHNLPIESNQELQ